MKFSVIVVLFVITCYSYQYICVETIEKKDDPDIAAIEITTVDRCITQHGKIVVRNLKGAITEIKVGDVVYPVSSTSNYQEIGVLDGYFPVRVIKRTVENICYYRQFEVTIHSKNECDPYYVYLVKTKEMVFEDDISNSTES
ncbi:hypothetical protein CL6EHI_042190 [Entamoeba histolytica]|uniref:Uncharacterized protein n=3 Tax=Entamoeba histolytica TaxID=5759 RepID=C4M4H3_ENTH1|nr:hypothetical protein EHI_042190 [Entamoeba histolytica HM-1:IMSS]EAL51157.1 hypothetical protein EHI_042190 [Entamoeba histolytica HM-1:IMSS]ENY64972.1 hypothetical protein EHI7A_080830 [Entamoeba histolytica HM-1:IMSS-A]GAT96272.1 hypothetical protein CL6EHI_042190 [Entamoeba histolytica]|eukprot:XP_656543.1 hypothetical protein EHI_042190 [Entamoeba histolytica HM-1:IMSS]